MIPIVPALIPKSAEEIIKTLPALVFSPEIHIDVVDGNYVPYLSWPYQPAGEPSEVKFVTDKFTLEVDLMVEDPLVAAETWISAGADMLVFHTEHITPEALARFADTTNVSIGIAAINDVSIDTIKSFLPHVDYLQLMGIAKVGSQGLSFDTRTLDRIKEIKKMYPSLSITIDGSVNKDTIKALAEAGADRFICGSAIVKASDPYQAYRELIALIN
jgi:ribulose-phosphate 3-epimerase